MRICETVQLVFLILFLAFVLALFPPLVSAAYIPRVYITKLDLDSSTVVGGGTVSGRFEVWNSEDSPSGMRYGIELCEGGGNEAVAPLVVDSALGTETITLQADQRKRVSFSYSPPKNIKSGTYNLKIQLETKGGLPASWKTVDLAVTGNEKFLYLAENVIIKGGTKYPPGSGIQFLLQEQVGLEFKAKNPNPIAISCLPKITIYKRSLYSQPIKTISKETVSFEPGETKVFTWEIPAFAPPQVYIAEVKFFDSYGLPISNSLPFRWVVSGESGEIFKVTSPQASYQKGDLANLSVECGGPADASNIGKGEVQVEVKDEKGEICGKGSKGIDLGPKSGEVNLSIPIENDCRGAKVLATLSKDGETLDSFEELPLIEKEKEQKWWEQLDLQILLKGGIAILALLLAFLIFKIYKEKRRLTLILLVAFLLPFIFPPSTHGGASIAWNKPVKDEEFAPKDSISFEGLLYMDFCVNHIYDWDATYSIVDDKDNPTKEVVVGETVVDDRGNESGHDYLIQVYNGDVKVIRNELGEPIEVIVPPGVNLLIEQTTTLHPSQWPGAPDSRNVTYPHFDPDNNPLSLKFPSGFPPGNVWAKVKLEAVHHIFEGGQHRFEMVYAEAYERIKVKEGRIEGYVWDDKDGDGEQDTAFGENPVKWATVYLDSFGGDLVAPVDGFDIEVPVEDHSIYIKPDSCWCLTRWNDGQSSKNYASDGTHFFAPLGKVEDKKFAYLGIQKADFKIKAPYFVAMEPDSSTSESVKIEKINNCWTGEFVSLSLAQVPPELTVALNPNGGQPNFKSTLSITSTVPGSYSFKILGSTSSLGQKEETVQVKVKDYPWFKTQKGDVHDNSNSGIYSPLPSDGLYFADFVVSSVALSSFGPAPGAHLNRASKEGWVLTNPPYGAIYDDESKIWPDFTQGFFVYYLKSFSPSKEVQRTSLDQSFFDGLNQNIVKVSSLTGTVKLDSPIELIEDKVGVVYINGNLVIENKVEFKGNSGVIFVVKKDLTVDSDVEQADGVFLVDGKITTAASDKKFVNHGGMYVSKTGSVSFNRNLADNTEAAEEFIFEPKYLIKFADLFGESRYKWREIAPY